MGVDLYAGPLCRLWARDYVSPVDELGGKPSIIFNPETKQVIPRQHAANLRPAVLEWKRYAMRVLRAGGADEVVWDDSPRGEYRCEQLTWSGWDAVKLWTAYAALPEFTPPDHPPTDETLKQDVAWATYYAAGPAPGFPTVGRCEFWMPVKLRHTVAVQLPSGRHAWCGSLTALVAELQEIEEAMADRGWSDAGGVQVPTEFRRVATSRLGQFRELAEFALSRPVPLVVDY